MSDLTDLFWKASLDELKHGWRYQDDTGCYVCLICGKAFTRGVVYPDGDLLYEAAKAAEVHITKEHGSVFQFLVGLDKKLTGLTDHQKKLLELLHAGLSDADAARQLGNVATSTIRNHRFALREKQKQAKVFLACMDLLGQRTPEQDRFVDIPRTTRCVDERFAITREESDKVLAKHLPHGSAGPLTAFPSREKRRIIVLREIMKAFEPGKTYAEKEVNAILSRFQSDYATLRRYLIEYGFMDRTNDGAAYWLKQ